MLSLIVLSALSLAEELDQVKLNALRLRNLARKRKGVT